jgi:prepilin-type N-terminal cleavage/methylation domain-containing protein
VRGFTLIETVTALAVASIILAGLGSILAMSLKAFPHPDADDAARAVSLQDAAQRFSDDLAEASSILSFNTDDMEFRVPDRDKDGDTEVIRYWWAGGSSALKRSVNGVETGDLGPALSSLKIEGSWLTSTGVPVAQTPTLRADETLLMVPGTGTTDTDMSATTVITSMYPVLTSDTTAWKPTSLQILTTTKGNTVLSTMRVRLYSGIIWNLLLQTPIATSTTVTFNSAATDRATTFTFSGAPELTPGTLLSVVVDTTVTTGSLSMRTSTSVPIYGMSLTTGAGLTWSTNLGGGVPCTLTGCQRRPSYVAADETRLSSVWVGMTPESERILPARFTVATLSEPVEE